MTEALEASEPKRDRAPVETDEARVLSSLEEQLLGEELQRSGEIYRLVVEHSRDLISLHDSEGRFLFASSSWETKLGYAPGELVGLDVFSLVHPEDLEAARAAMIDNAAGGAAVAEMRMRAKDGRWLELEGTATAIRSEGGRPGMILVSARDAGRRREADRRLAARTAVTRVLAESSTLREAAPKILRAVCASLGWATGGMWRVDRDRGVLRCVESWRQPSQEASSFVPLSRGTEFTLGIGLPGRVWSTKRPAWIPDVLEDANFPRAPAAAAEGLHGAFGFPIMLHGEVLGVIEFFSHEIREPDEDLLDVMSIIGSQIGQFMERTEAEEALRFQKAILESQSEAALDGILVVSADGRMISFNRRFVEMWGIPQEVVESRSDEAALASIRDDLEDPQEFLGRVSYLYEHPDEVSREEVRLKDGRTFDRYSAPIKEANGVLYGRVWYFRDITDRKRDEESLRFLASVSEMLTWSLDYRQILTRVARLAVRHLADWCIVYLAGDDGTIERVALEHIDQSKRDLARAFEGTFRINPAARQGVPEVLRTGRSQLHPEATAELVSGDVFEPLEQAEAIRSFDVRSWICVPLSARGRIFGAVSLMAGESGRRFGEAELAMAEDMARRVALAVDNARLYEERDHIARTLQRSFLPPQQPVIPGFEIHAAYLPAGHGNEVGGDFYDVFEVSQGRWTVVVGDVCGKGAEAAAVMALARYTLRAAAIGEHSPSRVLQALNRALMQQVSDGRFCTVCLVMLERRGDGAVATIASGGHPLPIVARAGGRVEIVGSSGTLLGVFGDPHLFDRRVSLSPGDVLVLYTDGVIERRRPGESFGEERLRALLASTTNANPQEIVDDIQRAVMEFGSEVPKDDIAIVALQLLADRDRA